MAENKQVDDILREIESHKVSKELHTNLPDFIPDAAPLEEARQRRADQIKEFALDLDVEAVMPDAENTIADTLITEEQAEQPQPSLQEDVDAFDNVPKKSKNKTVGRIVYALTVVVLSCVIALGGIAYFFDASGLGGSDKIVDVNIPRGAYTAQIANILMEKELINNTLFFRLYAKLSKADGLWQNGTFMLSANMGYSGIVQELQKSTPRANVNITIPEGYTVEEIAHLLAEKEVCTEEEFFNAVVNGSFDYDFIQAIPTAADGEQYAGRIYRLEGYLFPDTYNFYLGSSGEMVVRKMLDNFNNKISSDIRKKISDKGWTIDEAIIFASVIQGEAGKPDDMYAVSKVLTNRLQPHSGFPKLQCDATRDYVREILPSISGVEVTTSPYDTYVREGLPVGAINNPGLMAIDAALNPSADEKYADCFYFATDYDTGITYYSKTLAQHEAICRRYKIGMYG